MGNMVQLGSNIDLTAKIITTDTAEIVGAAKSKFKIDQVVQQLLSRPTTGGVASSGGDSIGEAGTVKSFGDLRVELEPLSIVNGNQFLLTMSLSNQNPKKTIWVALGNNSDATGWYLNGVIRDSEGIEFRNALSGVSGIQHTIISQYRYPNTNPFSPSTEIKPNESITATVKFVPSGQKPAAAGQCRLELEFLIGHDFSNGQGTADSHNLVCNISAD